MLMPADMIERIAYFALESEIGMSYYQLDAVMPLMHRFGVSLDILNHVDDELTEHFEFS